MDADEERVRELICDADTLLERNEFVRRTREVNFKSLLQQQGAKAEGDIELVAPLSCPPWPASMTTVSIAPALRIRLGRSTGSITFVKSMRETSGCPFSSAIG
jgi:hypothetical protein